MSKKTLTIELVLTILRREFPFVRDTYAVATLGVFGSYVRGDNTEQSDVDVLVSFSQVPSLFAFVELENYLTQALGVKVDLVMHSALKPQIGRQVLSEVVRV